MGNEVVIHVRAENDMRAGLASTKADASKTASDIEGEYKRVGKTISESGTKAGTDFGKKVTEGIGPGLRTTISDTKSQIASLDQEISKHRASLGVLAGAYASTGDAAKRMDLGKAFQGAEAEIRKLTKNKNVLEKMLPTPAEAEKAGAKMGQEVGSSFGEALSGLSSALAPVLAGVAIGAAPLIGATIAGAVIGGAGIGGVVGGVMLAARDPRIAFAGKQLGQSMLQDLTQRSSVFLEPVMHAITTVKSMFTDMGGDFSRIFNNSAKFLEPLTRGIMTMVQKITHGIADLTDAAGPVIEEISNGFAGIGGAIADVFHDLKDNGVDAAVALDVVFKMLEVTIRMVGGAINILTESFGFLAKIGAFGHDAQIEYIRLTENAKLAASASTEAASGLVKVGESASHASGPLATMDDKLNNIYNTEHKLFDSNTSTAEAFDQLTASIKKNGKSLDVHTEKGRANRSALSHLVTELNNQYKAYEEVNGVGAKANAVANGNYNSFIRAARGLGLSESAAKAYARSLGLIPPQKTTNFYANTHDAAGRLELLQERINAIHGKTVSVLVRTVTSGGNVHVTGPGGSGTQVKFAHGGIAGAATGGIHSGLRLVGEHGPELAELPPGTRINSNPDTERLLSGGGRGGGGMTLVVQSGGSKMDDLLVEILRNAVRVKGGGSVQTLLGRPGVAA